MAGAALVADFGLMTMIDLSAFLSGTINSPGGIWRWMSPELLDPEIFGSNGRLICGSDRYALGMVFYEVSLFHLLRRSLVHAFQVLTGLKLSYNTSCSARKAPTQASPRRVVGLLWHPLGVGAVVLE